jgi:hypothetical protein
MGSCLLPSLLENREHDACEFPQHILYHPNSGRIPKLCKLQDTWNGQLELVVMNSELIALFKGDMNGLEIYHLDIDPPALRKACFLEFPSVTPNTCIYLPSVTKEWIPTSKCYRQSGSSQGCHVSFYSSTVGTIALRLNYATTHRNIDPFICTMVISVPGLLSAIRPDIHNVPWEGWGPSSTHLFQGTLLLQAGPFWITDCQPLVVRDYDLLRVRYTQSMAKDMPSSSSLRPVVSSTEVRSEYWKAYKIETHLPHHDVVAKNLDFGRFQWTMADRQRIVGIMDLVRGFCVTYSYHSGVSLIIRTNRNREFPLQCIM